ncbi:ASKHA domain-containing protein [Sinanaerobacter sp. ZZT-01]|uniref:ASKHA domain-containing protein n=1 Tax=Sinanaerobacter sp. ZZT-01 TaxID=3111540 RepID=UPI002D7A1E3A|nr:ASKHA domain-containing protein [Sinanaerobacter sp. ZZT-01]WRR92584.1 ASKHA domain-containing protein [Sinanaerobacter sp. ZZT-01]
MKITFKPSGIEYELNEALTLLETAERAGVLIDGSCAGKGTCGKCKVRILQGKMGQLTDAEETALTDWEKEEGYRLACCIKPESDLVILVPGIHGGSTRKKDMTILPDDFVIEKTVVKTALQIKKASLEYQKSDADRILEALREKDKSFAALKVEFHKSLLQKIPEILKEKDENITLVIRNGVALDAEPGDTQEACYGIAFDIGTTTVVGMLWDLDKGKIAEVAARTNPQSVFGSDVISRIHYSNASADHVKDMQEKISSCFNDILTEFEEKANIKRNQVYEVTVVGNTTMSHLFLGINPASLARAPFAPVFCKAVNVLAEELEIDVNPNANVHLLPNIAGHVGSDIVAVLMASRLKEKAGCNLAIDIGTNGEILFAKDGRIVACSTAAGPAFEGAAIYQGMRAAAGAIERVTIAEGCVQLSVIDNEEPVGICGSGLIDAIAQMLDNGILDKKGRIISAEAARKADISENLIERLYNDNEGGGFILYKREDGENIVLTQKDIREVQLAKGAIFAGIKIMMCELGVKPEELDSVILAGAFGNYIKKESALRIGLFPKVAPENVISIGNAAGAGACMALLSDKERRQAALFAEETEHIELASHPDFQMEFLKAMYFMK